MDDVAIEIQSRHGIRREEQELEEFVDEVMKADLQMFVKSAYYDSVSQCCEFKFLMGLQSGEEVADQLLAIAERTIRQFEWFGAIHHGHIA